MLGESFSLSGSCQSSSLFLWSGQRWKWGHFPDKLELNFVSGCRMCSLIITQTAPTSCPSPTAMTARRVSGEKRNESELKLHPTCVLMCRVYFTWYQLIVTFIIPSVVMVTCYSIVINSLRRATNNMVIMTNRLITLPLSKKKNAPLNYL